MTRAPSGDGKWHEVALRLSGDDLAVDQIEALLGLAPQHSHLKGTPRPRGPGLHPESVWSARFTLDPSVPFEEQLRQWLPATAFFEAIVGLRQDVEEDFRELLTSDGDPSHNETLQRLDDGEYRLETLLYLSSAST